MFSGDIEEKQDWPGYGLTIEASTPQNGQQNGQTICQQQPKNCLSVFDYFVGLELKRLRNF